MRTCSLLRLRCTEIVALNLGLMVDGTFARGETFAPEQFDQATAHFYEHESSPTT